jgi:serine protease inhibitor
MKQFSIIIITSILWTTAFTQNDFAFEMHNQMDKEENILFSPTSIKAAFAMAYEGAKGSTQKEFEKVFDFTEDNEAFLKEIKSLKKNAEISNSIWVLEKYKILKSYVNAVSEKFDSEPYKTDFKNDPKGSAEKINKWIEESTNGMISKMLTAQDVQEFKMAIVNAVYFKKNWKNPFNKKWTQKGDFNNLDGSIKEVELMQQLDYYKAGTGDNSEKVIELPYEGDETSMIIILPKKMKNYELTNELYKDLNTKIYRRKVNLVLPKFTFGTPTFQLKPFLLKMGLVESFSNAANFSGMRAENDLKIGTALHKAKIIVNEEGTEAAAVTVIGMVKTTSVSRPTPPFEFRADKPFYYFIKDNKTGSIMFMGRMNKM